jgi:mutator protein MutT
MKVPGDKRLSPAVEVAAGVIFRASRVLIARRRQDDHLGGLWEFPGGKREPSETYQDCLRRELREELGIEVEIGPVLASLTHDYPEKTVHLEFFRCAWLRHEPRALGCAAFAWVDRAGLGQHDFPAADRQLLAKLQNTPDWW